MSLEVADTGKGALTIVAGDLELARYVYEPDVVQAEAPSPYLHPVRTTAGDVVSLFRPHDHRWHHGIQLALPHVADQNFWGGPTFVRDKGYQMLENSGTQRHDGFDEVAHDGGSARIGERLTWITQAGETWLTETRRLEFRLLGDDAWALTFRTSLTNRRGSVIAFGSPTTAGRPNAGYGGLFWRGPRSFDHGEILTSNGGGPEVMGTTAEWLAYVGRHDEVDRTSTIVLADTPGNPRYPTPWFVRDEPYACACPAPFFHTEYELGDGETLAFTYHIVIADGSWNADRVRAALASLP